MLDKVDYSIHYRRWNDGSLNDVAATARMYDRWIGREVRKHSSSSKVLDYGCGFGALVYFLTTHFDDVLGVDASEEQIEVAKHHDLPVELLLIKDFPTWCEKHSGAFDLIFLFDVLEHIPVAEQIIFMRALSGTLRQRGVMYIKVPNANSMLASRWRYIDWTHRSAFTECSLDFVCLNSGLRDIEYLDDESSIKPRHWWVPRWNMLRFAFKFLCRAIWKSYLKAELGAQADSIRVGYNLFARARKF